MADQGHFDKVALKSTKTKRQKKKKRMEGRGNEQQNSGELIPTFKTQVKSKKNETEILKEKQGDIKDMVSLIPSKERILKLVQTMLNA